MSIKAEAKCCPQCGGPIPAEAPQGLCPKCLLLQASLPTEAGKGAFSKSPPPTLEQLAAAFPQLEILGLIGQGGMGFVYKARQTKLDRFVALKILSHSLAADPAFAERFTREGRVLARLNHPNIVTVHDFGQANGYFYLLMEFVDGVNLRQAMKAGRFTPAQALAVVPKICEALEFAHSEGILHRDIKPENILLDSKGRVKIADFGIAKLLDESKADVLLTGTGANLGTPHYMAPEQIERPSEVDHRADIYSLGVVFYEMLTGELPLGRFVPPSEKSATDPRLDDVVLRTLAKEPGRRTQSAGEVKTQIDTIAQTPLSAPVAPAPGKTEDHFWKRFAIVVGLVLLGMMLIPVIAILLSIALPAFHRARTSRPSGQAAPAGASNEGTGRPVAGEYTQAALSDSAPAVKTITLTGATNQLIGASNDTRIVRLHTESYLVPGETLQASAKIPDGRHELINPSFFIMANPKSVSTSVYFSWALPSSFSEEDAEAATLQLRQNIVERPLTLTTGRPIPLFSITNRFGGIYAAYLEFKRSLPAPPARINGTNEPVRAQVHMRAYTPYVTSITYTAKVPSGYRLQATANEGQGHTSISDTQGTTEYRSTWFDSPGRLMSSTPARAARFPSDYQARQSALEAQLNALYEQGSFEVVLSRPQTVFALTNANGEVFQGMLELVGPPEPENK